MTLRQHIESKAVNCSHCGGRPRPSSVYGYSFILTCDDCYDGAPDAGRCRALARGKTWPETVADWNRIQEEV